MDRAYFKALNFKVDLGKYKFYDEGYVDSIIDANKKIKEGYKKNVLNLESIFPRIHGRCYRRGDNFHIFYLKSDIKVKDIQIRSHEETHVLDLTNCLDLLEDRMRGELHVNIDFDSIEDIEIKANLGSFYAIFSNNPPRPWNLISNSGIEEAFEIYKKSRLPIKKIFI